MFFIIIIVCMTGRPDFKIALFHAFFFHKGGGEKLIFELRNHLSAHLFASSIYFDNYGKEKEDSFSKDLFDRNYKLTYLHSESGNKLIRPLKRLYYFLFSSRIKELLYYDAVIFSGNVMFIQRRLKRLILSSGSKTKLIMYCHTPPRKLTDRFDDFIIARPALLRFLFKAAGIFILNQYIKDLKQMDLVFTNSSNTRKRLLDYTGIDSVIAYPPVNTSRFSYSPPGDYFLSYARLDGDKRIPLIIDAFAKMPDRKLVICSTGPLKDWLVKELDKRNPGNIKYEGLVTDERLRELVSGCIAGIYIPVNEDFGMTQIELMSAGKPVIGVKEGGLLETIADGRTGILIKSNPSADDLIDAVMKMTPELAEEMKQACEKNAKQYDSKHFFDKIDSELKNLFNSR